MVSKSYSLTKASEIIGVHRNTLKGWIEKKGCPFETRADRAAGKEWEISIPDVWEWRILNRIEEVLAGYQDDSGKISREEADRRRAVAQAITAEVSADEALDLVVARPEAEADVAAFCLGLKTGLSNASSRIASRAAAMTVAPEIQTLCETELNRAFDSAQAELAGKLASTQHDGEHSGADQLPPEG